MSKRVLIGVVTTALAIIAIVGVLFSPHRRWHASPTAPGPSERQELEFPSPEEFPDPHLPFEGIRLEPGDDQLIIHFDQPPPTSRTVMARAPWFGQFSADGATARLPNDARLYLRAFAVTFPKANDPETVEPVTERLRLRSPASNRLLTDDELNRFGIPEPFRLEEASGRFRPRLHLIFQSEGLPYFKARDIQLLDGRTNRNVSGSHYPNDVVHAPPSWHYLTCPLGIWHDTPLALGLDLLCGEMTTNTLRIQDNEFTVFEGFQRIEVASVLPGRPTFELPRDRDRLTIIRQNSPSEGLSALLLCSPNAYAGHWHFLERQEVEDSYKAPAFHGAWKNRLHVVDLAEAPTDKPLTLELGFMPYKARIWFLIPALSDMPNDHSVKNLFDVRIPMVHIGVPAGHPDFAKGFSADSIYDVVGGATEHSVGAWYWKTSLPDRTYFDTTPRQLLKDYLRHTPGTRVSIDSKDRVISISHSDTFAESIQSWWRTNKPGWLP